MEKPKVFTWADLKATIPAPNPESKPAAPAAAPDPPSDAARSTELLEMTYAKLNRVQMMREKTEAQQRARLESDSRNASTSPSQGRAPSQQPSAAATRSPGLESRSRGRKVGDMEEAQQIQQLKLKLANAGMTKTPASAYSKANRERERKQRAGAQKERSHSVDPSTRHSAPVRGVGQPDDVDQEEEPGTDPRKAWTQSLRGATKPAGSKIKPKSTRKETSVSAQRARAGSASSRVRPGSSAPPGHASSVSPAPSPRKPHQTSRQRSTPRNEPLATYTVPRRPQQHVGPNGAEGQSSVQLNAEENDMIEVFKERYQAQAETRSRLEDLTRAMEQEEEKMKLALSQFVRFRSKTHQSWAVERTLLETKVIELENSISTEQEEREKSVTLMREFKRDGGDVIKKLRESLHTVTNKYRQEVSTSIQLSEQLQELQSRYHTLEEKMDGNAALDGRGQQIQRELHTKLNHERKLHQTECEALEMKLQELSLVSEEDVKANEHLRSLLARANADRERLQAELERAHQRTGQPQQSNSESRTNELSSTLAEVGLDGLTVPQSMEEANVVIKAMAQQLSTEREMRLQTEEQTAVMQQQFENSIGLLENQNKDLSTKLQSQKRGAGSVNSPRTARPIPVSNSPTKQPAPSKPPVPTPATTGGDVDLAELKEEMMRTISSIQQSLDSEDP